jgi:hypothetical protein
MSGMATSRTTRVCGRRAYGFRPDSVKRLDRGALDSCIRSTQNNWVGEQFLAQDHATRKLGTAAPTARRRSDRVTLQVPVQVVGTDLSGKPILQDTSMKQVARYGGSVLLKALLGPGQVITLRHLARKKEVRARTVGQLGIQAHAQVYGIAFLEPHETFWGIHFPPYSESDDFLTRVVIECGVCARCEIVPFNEMELEVFEANDRISRSCESCNEWTFWKLANCERTATSPSPSGGIIASRAGETPPGAYTRRRRYPRLRVNLKGCIVLESKPETVVSVLDMSRGGLRFRTPQKYSVEQWVQVAAPYTIAAGNIFQPGRIVWSREPETSMLEYGLKYVKN